MKGGSLFIRILLGGVDHEVTVVSIATDHVLGALRIRVAPVNMLHFGGGIVKRRRYMLSHHVSKTGKVA